MSSLERLRRLLATGRSLRGGARAAAAETVFTTHTPVPAGQRGLQPDEVEPVLGRLHRRRSGSRAGPSTTSAASIPATTGKPTNITPLALRTSRAANAVSRRHGEVARGMWQPLWRDRRGGGRADRLRDQRRAHDDVDGGTDAGVARSPSRTRLARPPRRSRRCGSGSQAIPDAELWEVRCALREALVDYVRAQSIRDRLARGEPPDYVEAAARVFDPARADDRLRAPDGDLQALLPSHAAIRTAACGCSRTTHARSRS